MNGHIFRLGHADAGHLRVGENGIGDAVEIEGFARIGKGILNGDFSCLGRDRFELFASGDVTGGIDMGHAGPELLVHRDKAPLFDGDSKALQPESVNIAADPGGHQNLLGRQPALAGGCGHGHLLALGTSGDPLHGGLGDNLDPFFFKIVAQGIGNLLFLDAKDARRPRHQGHPGSHSAEDLGEFQTEKTGTEDHQGLRKSPQRQSFDVGQVACFFQAFKGGNPGGTAGGDQDLVAAHPPPGGLDRMGINQYPATLQKIDMPEVRQDVPVVLPP